MKRTLLFALLFALVFSGCKSTETKISDEAAGNTAGNINNSGLVAEKGQYCYYSATFDDKVLYRTSDSFKTMERIGGSTHGFDQLNVYGDYIYYTDGSPGFLRRMTLDGKKRKLLTLTEVGNVIIRSNWIFYRQSSFNDNWGKVYSTDLNGRNRKLLAERVLTFCVDGNTIYYSNMEDENTLWAMDVTGENKRKLVDKYVSGLNVDDRYIYYTEWETFNVFRTEKNTLKTECINSEKCEEINLYGEWIYYCNQNDKGRLCRISKDGKLKETLAEGRVATINVVDGMVFFLRLAEKEEDWGWFMLNLEDKTETKLADW